MKKLSTPLIAIALAATMAGCAKKPPETLPPEPVDTTSGSDTDVDPTANQQTGPTPGSQEDFVATVMSDRIFFDTDKFNVDGEDQRVLQSQAQWLSQYPNVSIVVEGHADERGTRDYNLALGERRANSAKNHLITLGVAASRIRTVSYGKERPQALGSNESAWAQNRRAVTVTVR
ncbi:peptidoglycan-associated lipoprotein Pal [Sphingorhabdus sp. Alg239-R122]|uniref:peptidoglycan-associated lipoprotein Pal n=1 Tax=Sphingorhabdus sp. Alg239-R122 TaxID=2305989 RepID=UPI0013D98F57|nr:peptidoglycan-associated lipoprotein Pal [Sphingorhabdus sp. Alg239-R122]